MPSWVPRRLEGHSHWQPVVFRGTWSAGRAGTEGREEAGSAHKAARTWVRCECPGCEAVGWLWFEDTLWLLVPSPGSMLNQVQWNSAHKDLFETVRSLHFRSCDMALRRSPKQLLWEKRIPRESSVMICSLSLCLQCSLFTATEAEPISWIMSWSSCQLWGHCSKPRTWQLRDCSSGTYLGVV